MRTIFEVLEPLRRYGVELADYRRPGRPGRFEPHGVIWHHTAGPPGDMPSLGLCMYGNAAVPGPFCQILIGRTGRVAVITDGRANHAGKGIYPGIARNNGNAEMVGVEIENDGIGEPYTAGLLRVCIAVGVALGNEFGHLHIGHKEYSSEGKPDPLFDMDLFRGAIARAANTPPAPEPPNIALHEDEQMIQLAVTNDPKFPYGPGVGAGVRLAWNGAALSWLKSGHGVAVLERAEVRLVEITVDEIRGILESVPGAGLSPHTAGASFGW